jgi:hypothetical protein
MRAPFLLLPLVYFAAPAHSAVSVSKGVDLFNAFKALEPEIWLTANIGLTGAQLCTIRLDGEESLQRSATADK